MSHVYLFAGPLAPCHNVVSPTPFYDGCVYDLCATLPDTQFLCNDVADYVRMCQQEGVVFTQPWRDDANCRK